MTSRLWQKALHLYEHPSGVHLGVMHTGPESVFPGSHYYIPAEYQALEHAIRQAHAVVAWETAQDPDFNPERVSLLLAGELSLAQLEEAVFTAGRAGVGIDAAEDGAMQSLDRFNRSLGGGVMDRLPNKPGPARRPGDLTAHAEAAAQLMEEIVERLDLMRDELWTLRAGLGREVGQ